MGRRLCKTSALRLHTLIQEGHELRSGSQHLGGLVCAGPLHARGIDRELSLGGRQLDIPVIRVMGSRKEWEWGWNRVGYRQKMD
jgi:hypothetical protein